MSRDKKLFELLKKLAVQSGKLALPHYGKIASQVKLVPLHAHVRETPVTALDHGIQELVLASLLQNGYEDYAFNGEEDTHLKFFFPKELDKGTCIHCDPIDGTRAFVEGKLPFCVGFGLSRVKKQKHDFFASVVYNPVSKQLYWAYEDRSSPQLPLENPPKVAYFKRRLNDAGIKRVESLGYTWGIGASAHLGVVETSLGMRSVCALKNIPVHDALIPYAFARAKGVIPVDVDGKKLTHGLALPLHGNKFDSIPSINYFANKEAQEELLPILQNPNYLHQ
ncbi:MAG: hypothetical protein IPJ89_02430 [Candidatus Iainarchaeum archaeon]|uniref:Inositol monophosphatase n=1 Tax=Candidatus Iainarchaeum sp. TaxID=3101447 RepID=A0A7T9DKM5_9ARCH|nr:MAG: hypothetical protein IPJ89_02430 [Candidatus Diapherotrites archaeon]